MLVVHAFIAESPVRHGAIAAQVTQALRELAAGTK